jgi:hypothetical protein
MESVMPRTGLPPPLVSSKDLMAKAKRVIHSCVHLEQLHVAYTFYTNVIFRFEYSNEERLWMSHILEWETEARADGYLLESYRFEVQTIGALGNDG